MLESASKLIKLHTWILQTPDFDGKEISLKLNSDGNLGTFEGSSGNMNLLIGCFSLSIFVSSVHCYICDKLAWYMHVTGKSYDLVSFKSQEADATVFLPTASDSKIGKNFLLLGTFM